MPKPHERAKSFQYLGNFSSSTGEASGIYTWVVATDTIYCDALVAEVFGFDPEDSRRGLPFKDYLARMHPDDLPRVAKAIHDTLTSNRPFSEQYRICRPDGSTVEISAFGCCFRDCANEPSHYSGIVVPINQVDDNENTLIGHLIAAHDIARCQGNIGLVEKIVDALVEIGLQDGDNDGEPGVRATPLN